MREFSWKWHAGNPGVAYACALDTGPGKIDSTQVGGTEIAVAEVDSCSIYAPQGQMAKVALGKLGLTGLRLTGFKLLDLAVAQRTIQRVLKGSGLRAVEFDS